MVDHLQYALATALTFMWGCGSSTVVGQPEDAMPDGAVPAAVPCGDGTPATFAWGFGVEGGRGYAVSVGQDGAIYLGGVGDLTLPRCEGALVFGQGNGFIARLREGGGVVWERRLALGLNDPRGIVLDARYGPGVAFAAHTATGADVGFGMMPQGVTVGRLDEDGAPIVARNLEAVQVPFDMAVGMDGSLLMAAECPGSLTVDGTSLCAHEYDAFVLRLGPDGDIAAHRTFSGDPSATVPAVVLSGCAIAPSGETIIAGQLVLATDLGHGVDENESGMFLARYDAEFSLQTTRVFPDLCSIFAHLVADPLTGDVLFAGDMGGPHDLGGGVLPCGMAADVFVARYDAQLEHLWSHAFASSLPDVVEGLDASPLGDTLIVARLGNTGESPGLADTQPSFVELDTLGVASAPRQLPVQFVRDVAATPDGGRVITGSLYGHDGPADFGSGPLEGSGYLVKLAAP